MMRDYSRRRAFSLIEIMIAIAILSVVVGAIYATWRMIISATKSGQTAAAQVQRRRVALRCIEESLTYTVMFAANSSRYYSFVAENGSDATISFVSQLPNDFPRSGRFGGFTVRRLAYSIESGEDGGRDLVLRQAPIMTEFDQDEQEHPLVLMRNVKKMEMEFWDEAKKDWTDEWLLTNQVPRLIRVAITTDNPQNPFDRGEEHIQIVSPAAAAVQAGWQALPPIAPNQPPPGGQPPVLR